MRSAVRAQARLPSDIAAWDACIAIAEDDCPAPAMIEKKAGVNTATCVGECAENTAITQFIYQDGPAPNCAEVAQFLAQEAQTWDPATSSYQTTGVVCSVDCSSAEKAQLYREFGLDMTELGVCSTGEAYAPPACAKVAQFGGDNFLACMPPSLPAGSCMSMGGKTTCTPYWCVSGSADNGSGEVKATPLTRAEGGPTCPASPAAGSTSAAPAAVLLAPVAAAVAVAGAALL